MENRLWYGGSKTIVSPYNFISTKWGVAVQTTKLCPGCLIFSGGDGTIRPVVTRFVRLAPAVFGGRHSFERGTHPWQAAVALKLEWPLALCGRSAPKKTGTGTVYSKASVQFGAGAFAFCVLKQKESPFMSKKVAVIMGSDSDLDRKSVV